MDVFAAAVAEIHADQEISVAAILTHVDGGPPLTLRVLPVEELTEPGMRGSARRAFVDILRADTTPVPGDRFYYLDREDELFEVTNVERHDPWTWRCQLSRILG